MRFHKQFLVAAAFATITVLEVADACGVAGDLYQANSTNGSI